MSRSREVDIFFNRFNGGWGRRVGNAATSTVTLDITEFIFRFIIEDYKQLK